MKIGDVYEVDGQQFQVVDVQESVQSDGTTVTVVTAAPLV